MRSLRDLVRTYVSVNGPRATRVPVRFGAALLVAVGLAGLYLLVGDGPQPYSSSPPAATGVPDGQGRAADEWFLAALPGGGVYVGYPSATFDPSLADGYDLEAVRDAAIAWHLDHPGSEPPEPVLVDGYLIGFMVRD